MYVILFLRKESFEKKIFQNNFIDLSEWKNKLQFVLFT